MKSFLKGIGVGLAIAAIGGGMTAAYMAGKYHATQEDILKNLNTPPPAATYELQPPPTSGSTQTIPHEERAAVPYKSLKRSEVIKKYSFSFADALRFIPSSSTPFNYIPPKDQLEQGLGSLAGIEGDFTNDGLPDAFIAFLGTGGTVRQWGLENTGIGYKLIKQEQNFRFTENGPYGDDPDGNRSLTDANAINNIYPVNFDNGTAEIVLELVNNNTELQFTKWYVIYSFQSGHDTQTIRDNLSSEPIVWDFDDDGNYEFGIFRYLGKPITIFKYGGERLGRMPDIEIEIESALKATTKILSPSVSKEEMLTRLETVWNSYDDNTVLSTFLILGGEDLRNNIGRLTTENDAPEFVRRASEQLRQEGWSILLEDLPSGNYATMAMRLINAVLITEATKKSVTGITAPPSSSQIQETPLGFTAYFGNQSYSYFRTREEAEEFLRREQVTQRNEPAWRDIWSETDPYTGTTKTISSWVTEEEAERSRMQMQIEKGIEREKEMFGFSPAEETGKAVNFLLNLLSQK